LEDNIEDFYEQKKSLLEKKKKIVLNKEEDVNFDEEKLRCEGLPAD